MKQHPSRHLFAIFILSVAVRRGALCLGHEVDAPELLTDQRSYQALGGWLISGQGCGFSDNWCP